jgi:hypothetical protein
MNLTNEKSEVITPEYYYRVQECGTRINKDGSSHEPFRTDLDFKCDDLLEGRAAAKSWYMKKLLDGNSSESLSLSLVEELGNKHLIQEYFLLGEDEDTTTEGREYESNVLESLGLTLNDES